MKSDFGFLEICFRAVFALGECGSQAVFLLLGLLLASCGDAYMEYNSRTFMFRY